MWCCISVWCTYLCLFYVKSSYVNDHHTIVQPPFDLPLRESKVTLNGYEINYVQTGHGPNAILLLTSAFGTISSDFGPHLNCFDHNELTMVALEAQGFGNSRPPDRDFKQGFFLRDADVAAKLMEHLKIYNYSVLGYGDSGVTAMMLTAQNAKVYRLILLGAFAYIIESQAVMYECKPVNFCLSVTHSHLYYQCRI